MLIACIDFFELLCLKFYHTNEILNYLVNKILKNSKQDTRLNFILSRAEFQLKFSSTRLQ